MTDRPSDPTDPARLPVPAGLGRGLVLASVFVCAACGLVYELELVALASYLAGDSVTQASVVLSVMVFAMGIGSLLAKRLRCRAATGFGVVEALLALVGGGSAMALYASFAWLGEARVSLVVFSLAIGALTGAEMPLLMTLIQRVRRQDPGGAVADLFAADYVGALVGGLTFPFLLLPFLGQLTGALLTGVVNAVAGGVVVLWLFRRDVGTRVRWCLLAANGAAVLLLVAGTAVVGPFEQAARQAVYGGEVRVAVHSDLQEIVLTGPARPAAAPAGAGGPAPTGASAPLELFLDGRLRASSTDERRFHRALVGPAMAAGRHARVLVLGGGDGLALREVLRYPDVREVTVLEGDPRLAALARTDPGLRRLNGDAYRDPRVRLRTGDAFRRLREGGAPPYDVIVSDLPEPHDSATTKLYSEEFYGLAARALSSRGRIAVHAGGLGARPRDLWTAEATLRSAGLHTRPYVVGRRQGAARGAGRGDWGFVLATSAPRPQAAGVQAAPVRSRTAEPGRTDRPAHPAARGGGPRGRTAGLRLGLTSAELQAARRRAERHRIGGLPPSTLMRPRY